MNGKKVVNLVDFNNNEVLATLIVEDSQYPGKEIQAMIQDAVEELGEDEWEMEDLLALLPFDFIEVESVSGKLKAA